MPWLQLKINAQREQTEAIEDSLLSAGAAAVTLEDDADEPILEPALGEMPLWQHTAIIGLFDAEVDTDGTIHVIEVALGHSLPPHRWELLEDKDWERAWMDNFHPIQFGTRLWVCPSWREPPDPKAANLLLDPGLAFGTGTHPTTALCLDWLAHHDVIGKTVIDYGCGSGILGIAALLLGAQSVIAIDNDPQALIATRDNAQRNGIADEKLLTHLPGQIPSSHQVDIVLANILAGPLTELAPALVGHTCAGGQIVLSGILANQSENLTTTYRQWCEIEPITLREDWARIDGRRK